MSKQTYNRGDVIFRQGDSADSMFAIGWGSVGIYLNYGTKEQKLLNKIEGGDYFGEMGMIEHEPRSATAVAMENGTQLTEFRDTDLEGILKSNPGRILDIMQQLSRRLRRLTQDYQTACETAANVVRAEDKGESDMTQEEIGIRVSHYADEIDKAKAARL